MLATQSALRAINRSSEADDEQTGSETVPDGRSVGLVVRCYNSWCREKKVIHQFLYPFKHTILTLAVRNTIAEMANKFPRETKMAFQQFFFSFYRSPLQKVLLEMTRIVRECTVHGGGSKHRDKNPPSLSWANWFRRVGGTQLRVAVFRINVVFK